MVYRIICVILGVLFISGCNSQQPTRLSGKIETIEVAYVNWACDCADYIETKYFSVNPDYEIMEEDCIFIEPSNPDKKIPESYYYDGHSTYYLKLRGQFYLDKGVPDSYERKTPETPKQARVFCYDSFQLVEK